MSSQHRLRGFAAVGSIAAVSLALAGCASGGSSDGSVEISWLVNSGDANELLAAAVIEAFEAENPNVTVNLDLRPAGTEGDNLIKTQLSTGEMSDVFYYNSGSLLQALNPDQTLVNLADEPWVADTTDDFQRVVSTENGLYGSPMGSAFAGGIVYNKPIYAELGLEIPTSWDEFMANSEAIKAAGIAAPIIQTFGDTWTSQLFVLGDFANVDAADPDWADAYTANERKYSDEPAIAGFEHQQAVFEAGLLNEDYPSATFEDGARMIATGEGAQYPILTGVLGTIQANNPDNIDDVGVFPIPADDPDDTSLTMWLPNANYIPKTTEGAELEAAKALIAFINTAPGCDLQNEHLTAAGPYAISTCVLPDGAPALIAELQSYVDDGKSAPALEFLSPIKGPNLENITVEVGSGISSAADGAAQYDEDVKKQAQQLGLDGW